MIKISLLSQVWWLKLVILATWEADTGGNGGLMPAGTKS
jgi:hypothetical protein